MEYKYFQHYLIGGCLMTKIIKMSFSFKLNEDFDQIPEIFKEFLDKVISNFKNEFQIEVEAEKKFYFIEY